MGLFATEFLESKREILNDKGVFWSDPLLLFTLNEAYKALQIDVPYFKEIKKFPTIEGEWKYHIDGILQPIHVIVDGYEYDILSDTKFFDKRDIEDNICTAYDYALCLSKIPTKSGKIIDCRYKYMQQIITMECEIRIPDHYMEALHAKFLSKVWEKNPDRKDRTLVDAYKRDYLLAIDTLKESARSKPRRKKSKYKKV